MVVLETIEQLFIFYNSMTMKNIIIIRIMYKRVIEPIQGRLPKREKIINMV